MHLHAVPKYRISPVEARISIAVDVIRIDDSGLLALNFTGKVTLP